MSKDIPAFAFPIHPDVDLNHDQIWRGMTLRDYFAAKAMPELIGFGSPENGAEVAYKWADAMMKAREQ